MKPTVGRCVLEQRNPDHPEVSSISVSTNSTSEARQRPEPLGALPTEARNPRSTRIDELSTLEMLGVVNDEDATIAARVRQVLPRVAAVVDAVTDRFARGGRLLYVGAGTSGRLGVLDASECPPTFSVPPGVFVGLIAGGDSALRTSSESSEDSPEAGARDLEPFGLGEHDTVLGIAASGRTPYVLGALAYATEHRALTVALTCAGGAEHPSRMAAAAELAVEMATGPEVLTGSTRMKAGTATKLVLNMISTGVMIRSGAVYGNLMVNVQPTNAKLVDRAQRIIVEATGCGRDEAALLLDQAGSVKTAIAMQLLGLDRPEAESLLATHLGRLAVALQR
jgi:N-acetylmuramic acid 6-phosphate etherase